MIMKHRFRLSIVALLLLPLIVACGGTPQAPAAQSSPAAQSPAAAAASGAAQSQPVADVTVTIPYLPDGITSFDHAYWTSQLLVAQGTIFEGLYGYDQQLNVVPKVAVSATPNADNTVWTVKLRQDKKWSNGDAVTANDFYASWMRFMGPELKDSPMWAGMWGAIKNSWAYKGGAETAENVGLKVIDDYTLEITLTQPNAALTPLMAVSSSMPINAKSLQEHPTDWWQPANGVFNGPYIVKEWTSGADAVLTRNPNYVGEGIGNIGTLVLRPYKDANARLQAFENGEIQFTFLEDASQLAYAQNNPLIKDTIKSEVNDLAWRGIQYNRSLDPGPLSDIRVRQAFAMAIDKQTITDNVLKGLAVPTSSFSGDAEVASKVKPLAYDVTKAKQLLAEAGFPDGQGFPELTFYAPPANDAQMPMIEAVVKMWQDNLGVPIKIQNNENAVYSTLQWSDYNRDIEPGFATLNGVMNWFQPEDLVLSTNHIWYFMDYEPEGMTTYANYKDEINAVTNLTATGDWAALETRATEAWAHREEIVAKEDNQYGRNMVIAPTFKDQWDAISKRFNEAADDAAKLSAYQDGLTLVLKEEQSAAQYDMMTEANRQAQRSIADLKLQTVDQASDNLVPLLQAAIDSAWMIPIYNEKLYYATDAKLSGVVLNKLSWGHNFQFQYLQWSE